MSEQNDISVVGTAPTDDDISVVGTTDPNQDPAPQDPQQNGADPTEGDPQQTDQGQIKSTGQVQTKPDDKPAAPEKYEFALPEGYVIDEAAVDAVTPILKDLGCSQEVAQKLVDLHFSQIKAMQEAREKARAETFAQWAKEIKADKDIGGPNVLQNLLPGTRLLDRFGSPALKELLQESGLDRHPAVAKFLVAVGREFSEDRWADGGKRGPAGVRTPEAVAKQIFDKTL